jgi:hypothetical protein
VRAWLQTDLLRPRRCGCRSWVAPCWRRGGQLLPRAGELRLCFGQFLTRGLQPTFELSYRLVALRKVTGGPGELGLELRLLALRLRLFGRELVPACCCRCDGGLKLLTLLGKPLLFRTRIGELSLGSGLGIARLLQALLRVGNLGGFRRQLLCGAAQVLSHRRLLAACLLKLAADIGNLTGLRQDSLLTGRNLLLERGKPLLGLRQLILQLGEALGLTIVLRLTSAARCSAACSSSWVAVTRA